MSKKLYKALIIGLCMLLLILDTKTAISGANEGVELCIRVLIPSLFPFFLVSILLTNLLSGSSTTITRHIAALLNIPHGAESLFLVGLLGGYPVGAQAITQATENGTLDKRDALRMMAFCNQAGPAFIFGVISSQFPDQIYPWLIWMIIIFSTIITAIILPGGSTIEIGTKDKKQITLTQAMEKSIKALSGVCGWVIIFRVILAFLERWFLWLLPDVSHIVIRMLLELVNGSIALIEIENLPLRFVVCTAGLSLGGFCVILQTISVSGQLGIGKYIPGKLIQTAVSLLLSFPVVFIIHKGYSPIYMIAPILCYIPLLIILSQYRKKQQNRYGILLSGSV